jgi:iron complex outermembrane recepter protein
MVGALWGSKHEFWLGLTGQGGQFMQMRLSRINEISAMPFSPRYLPLIAFNLFAVPAMAAGDTASGEEASITVTASRTGADIRDLPIAVSVVDAEAIGRQLGQSTDILRLLDVTVPGLNLSTGGRSQCQATIRGRTPNFMLNGVPANQDLRPSNCNSAFQITPFALERVEVVRGATALFGAGAPGGIVNFIMRRGRSETVQLDAVAQTGFSTARAAGSFQTDLYAGIGQDTGAIDYYVGLGYQDYGVSRDPNGNRAVGTAFDAVSLNANVGVQVSDSVRVRMTGSFYREDPGQEFNVSGVDVSAGVPFPRIIAVTPNPRRVAEGRDQLWTLALTLDADDVLGQRLNMVAYGMGQQFRQRANFQDFNDGNPDFFSDDRTNSTHGLRGTLNKDFDLGGDARLNLTYGLDWRQDRLIRLLLDPNETSIVTGFIAPEIILNSTGLFGQADLKLGALRLSGGVRQEWYRGRIGDELAGLGLSGTGTPGRLAPASLLLANVGAVWAVADDMQLYASFNQGAELTQLGRAARRAADPSIISPEPARSDQYEAGLRGKAGPVDFTLAAFYSRSAAASLLQPDPGCAGQSFCPLIPLRVPQRVWGAEATARWQATKQLALGGLLTWQRGEIFDEDFGRFIPFGTDTVSPTRITAHADWSPAEALSARLQATWVGRADFFTPAEQAFGFINTPSNFLVDVSAGWQLGPGELTVGASNLFNRRFENITLAAGGFTPALAPGRQVSIGYRLKLR